MKQEIRSERIRESYQKMDHPSGLTLLLYPMEGFSSAYAMLTTDYGSVDMAFRTDPKADFTRIPAGTAHFLCNGYRPRHMPSRPVPESIRAGTDAAT